MSDAYCIHGIADRRLCDVCTSSETLRTYAAILEKPKRVFDEVAKRMVTRQPGEILIAASVALRLQADTIDRIADGQSE